MTYEAVLLAASAVLFGGMTAAVVWLFRKADEEADWDSERRRRLAARSFYLGAGLALLSLWGLAASFVVDVDEVLGFDPLLAGVGGVVVASMPLAVGITLAFDAAMGS